MKTRIKKELALHNAILQGRIATDQFGKVHIFQSQWKATKMKENVQRKLRKEVK